MSFSLSSKGAGRSHLKLKGPNFEGPFFLGKSVRISQRLKLICLRKGEEKNRTWMKKVLCCWEKTKEMRKWESGNDHFILFRMHNSTVAECWLVRA
uniref:Uncharacterized protein n=1 Tax=Rosa rugosa TaxID=74645 RepID=J7G5A3_ROSRU|nr:hypothetical protein [Rosa rugosa]